LAEDFFNYWNVLKAIDNYLIVTYNLYTITYACYYGVLEIVELMLDYFIWRNDLKMLWFNWGYNLGAIATNIKNIWMWSVATEYTRIDGAFTMGLELGQIFWMLFYPTEIYLDDSLARNDTVWGQDWTWDAIIYRRELVPGEEHDPITGIIDFEEFEVLKAED